MSSCDSFSSSPPMVDTSSNPGSLATASKGANTTTTTILTKEASRNRCVTCTIIVLSICGLGCGLYGGLSCEWFAWEPLPLQQVFGVFAEYTAINQADSVGLFRYYDAASSSCQVYPSDGWWLLSRRDDSWMFAGQLCVLIVPALVIVSVLLNCCGGDGDGRQQQQQHRLRKCPASTGWLLATGLQTAASLAATAMCPSNDFWECPWLKGAHASAGAAFFFLLCWLLSMCGYQETATGSTVNHHHYHHHHSTTKTASKIEERGHTMCLESSSSSSGSNEGDLQDVEFGHGAGAPNKLTAEELLGTTDPVITRAVGQHAHAIREFAHSTDPLELDSFSSSFQEEEEVPVP